MIGRWNTPGSRSWVEELAEIGEALREYNDHLTMMTPYEQRAIGLSVYRRRDEIAPRIRQCAIAEWDQAIQNVRAAHQRVNAEKTKEAARWDSSRLHSEMELARSRVVNAIGAESSNGRIAQESWDMLDRIYQDAQQSGDIYKIRATDEVYLGLLSHVKSNDMDERMKAHGYGVRARQDLAKVRTTPELEAAHKAAAETYDGLTEARKMLGVVAENLGFTAPNGMIEDSEIDKALRRVTQNGRGPLLIDGEEMQ